MNIGTNDIDASIATVSQSDTFPTEMLKDVVAALFWQMWNAWEPQEGRKVVAEGYSTV